MIFLADNPRQDEASLELVRQMLPFWYDGTMWSNREKSEESDSMSQDDSGRDGGFKVFNPG